MCVLPPSSLSSTQISSVRRRAEAEQAWGTVRRTTAGGGGGGSEGGTAPSGLTGETRPGGGTAPSGSMRPLRPASLDEVSEEDATVDGDLGGSFFPSPASGGDVAEEGSGRRGYEARR